MKSFGIKPQLMIGSLWQNRELIASMTKREVVGRYRGSMLGILWSFFNPLLMLSVYTFFFSVVLKSRWTPTSDSSVEFALILFPGLIVFNLFSECANRAPALVISNTGYVKKVVFPLEVLPVVSLGAALFHCLVSFAVWMIFSLITVGIPPTTWLLIPVLMLPTLLFTLGISWFLAAMGVYLRDVSQFIGVVTQAMMFLSPVFYPVGNLPEAYRPFLMANPLTPAIEQIRDALIWGKIPELNFFLAYLAATALIAWLGFAWFQKTRKGFADVL